MEITSKKNRLNSFRNSVKTHYKKDVDIDDLRELIDNSPDYEQSKWDILREIYAYFCLSGILLIGILGGLSTLYLVTNGYITHQLQPITYLSSAFMSYMSAIIIYYIIEWGLVELLLGDGKE